MTCFGYLLSFFRFSSILIWFFVLTTSNHRLYWPYFVLLAVRSITSANHTSFIFHSLLLSKRIENRWLSFLITIDVENGKKKKKSICRSIFLSLSLSRVWRKHNGSVLPLLCAAHSSRCGSSSIVTIVELAWPFSVPGPTSQSQFSDNQNASPEQDQTSEEIKLWKRSTS